MTRPLAAVEAELRGLACSDGGCVILRPKGMHTNGGCRCVRDLLDGETSRNRITRILNLKDERAEAIRALERAMVGARERAMVESEIVAFLRRRDTVWSKDYADQIEEGRHRGR